MSDWNPECEALFEVGREMNDDPGLDDRRRVARRVAARLAIGVTVVTTAEAGRAATVGAAVAGGLASKSPSLLTVGKILLTLAVGVGGSAVVGSVLSRHHGAPPSVQTVPPNAVGTSETALAVPLVDSRPTQPVAAVEPPSNASPLVSPALPKAANRPARSATATRIPIASPSPVQAEARSPLDSSPASTASSTPTPYDATGEIGALKEIDEAIRRGDFSRASALLNDYDATAGIKHFAPEYQAARVLVLCGSGQTDAGQRAACAFLASYPRSPVSARIEAACSPRCGDR